MPQIGTEAQRNVGATFMTPVFMLCYYRGEGKRLRYKVFLGLGSNIGDRQKNIKNAIDRLKKVNNVKIEKVSSFYESEPWGKTGQDKFLNAVIKIETDIEPKELLLIIKGIEDKMGRKQTYRWGPRVIDIDMLLYDNLKIDMQDLKIPHPFMKERGFVLIPLKEIEKGFIFPDGDSIDKVVELINKEDVKLYKRL